MRGDVRRELVSLYRDSRPSLQRTIERIVGCPHAADELVQESFLRCLEVASARRVAQPRAFLFQVARNLAIDAVRRRRFQGELAPALRAQAHTWGEAASGDAGEMRQDSRRRAEVMLRALRQLPERDRAIFLRAKLDGWPQAEIARHYGVSLSTVEKTLRRVTAACRAALGEDAPP